MAHTHFKCPDEFMHDIGDDGELSDLVTIKDCLNCSLTRHDRTCEWDYADLTLRVDRSATYASFTPSKMLGCNREQWYRRNTDYAVNPPDKSAMVRGTRAHSKLEVETPSIIGEITVVRRLDVQYQGRTVWIPITVRPDKVYPDLGMIHDDKTRGYLQSVNKKAVAPDWSWDYQFQLSVGAWAWAQPWFVVREDHSVEMNPKGLNITKGQIIFRDSNKQVRQDYDLMRFDILESEMRKRCLVELAMHDTNEIPEMLQGEDTWKCRTCPHHQNNGGPCASVIQKRDRPEKPVSDKPVRVAPVRRGAPVSKVRAIR